MKHDKDLESYIEKGFTKDPAKPKETYKQQCVCMNCGYKWVVAFEFGRSVPTMILCPNCGVRDGKSMGLPKEKDIRW